MPVSIRLKTVPAHFEERLYGRCKVTELFGDSLHDETIHNLKTVADIRLAVGAFGAKVAEAHPDESFSIVVILDRSSRKPAGFNIAAERNGFGQENFVKTQETT